MNRYTRDGLLNDMRDGKRVLYLGPTRGEAMDVLCELSPLLHEGERVMRTHGMEQVLCPASGGRVKLSSAGSSLRGLSADVVVVAADLTGRQLAELDPILYRAELVRA